MFWQVRATSDAVLLAIDRGSLDLHDHVELQKIFERYASVVERGQRFMTLDDFSKAVRVSGDDGITTVAEQLVESKPRIGREVSEVMKTAIARVGYGMAYIVMA